MDANTEAYIDRLLAEAPHLTPEQAALVARTFNTIHDNRTDTDAA